MSAVCFPLVSLCFWNILNERPEINFATKKLRGVRQITRRVIHTFFENMKNSVTIMVTMPENSCVKPSRRPSDKISVSAITRLTMSPELC